MISTMMMMVNDNALEIEGKRRKEKIIIISVCPSILRKVLVYQDKKSRMEKKDQIQSRGYINPSKELKRREEEGRRKPEELNLKSHR